MKMTLEKALVQKYSCKWKDAHEVVLALKKEKGLGKNHQLNLKEQEEFMDLASQQWEDSQANHEKHFQAEKANAEQKALEDKLAAEREQEEAEIAEFNATHCWC